MPDSPSFADMFVREKERTLEAQAKQMAEMIGPPANSETLSDQQAAQLWAVRNWAVDPVTLAQQGMKPGEIMDQVFPMRRELMTRGRPSPRDQVEYAKRLSKLAAQTETEGFDGNMG